MAAIEIKFFGIGSAKIITDKITVLIDAFGEFVKDIHPAGKNLILITHNDNDHFLPLKVAKAAIDTKSKVIVPPGIAYPLLVDGKLPPEQLEIIYPVHLKKPVEKNITTRGAVRTRCANCGPGLTGSGGVTPGGTP